MRRRAWAVALVGAGIALVPHGVSAQDDDLTVRQVLDIFEEDDDHPPLTEGRPPADDEVVLPEDGDGKRVYLVGPAVLTSADIVTAEPVPVGANWSVRLELAEPAQETWADFTSELACLRDEGDPIKSQAAVVVDDEVVTSAGMQEPLGGGAGGGVECGTGIEGGDISIDVSDQQEAETLAVALGGTVATPEASSAVPETTPGPGPREGGGGSAAGIVIGVLGVSLVVLMTRRSFGSLGRRD